MLRSDSSSSQLGVTTRCALLQPTCEKDVKGTNNDFYFTLIIWNFDLVVSELDDETNGLAPATVLDRVAGGATLWNHSGAPGTHQDIPERARHRSRPRRSSRKSGSWATSRGTSPGNSS